MIGPAWVTLRQYRFEVAVSTFAAVAAAVLGANIAVQIDGLEASRECLDRARAMQDASGLEEDCLALLRAGSTILGEIYVGGEGTLQLSLMGVLPFVIGLLGGLPIVATELEERTAQTAWWLNPSRPRWLIRQIAPIGLLLAIVVGLASVVATPVSEAYVDWGLGAASELIGQHGPLLMLRAFAAFGIALAVGALLGRMLPGFIFSVAVVLAVLMLIGQAREAWTSQLPLTPLATRSTETGQWMIIPGGQVRSFGFISPDGRFLTRQEARQQATEAGIPPAAPGDEQDIPAALWLGENGYFEVPLGVSDEEAMGWATYDGLAFAIVGCAALAGAFVIVNRRRPL